MTLECTLGDYASEIAKILNTTIEEVTQALDASRPLESIDENKNEVDNVRIFNAFFVSSVYNILYLLWYLSGILDD